MSQGTEPFIEGTADRYASGRDYRAEEIPDHHEVDSDRTVPGQDKCDEEERQESARKQLVGFEPMQKPCRLRVVRAMSGCGT